MVDKTLIDFLKRFPKKNGKHTHIIYAPSPGGSYTIPSENMDEFYNIMNNSIR